MTVAEPSFEQQTPSSEQYIWTFPGAPIRVHLDLAIVERLRELLLKTDSGQASGFLLGSATSPTTVKITDSREIPNNEGDPAKLVENMEGLRSSIQAETNGLTIVGFYRHRNGEGLQLEKDDLLVMQNHLSEPANVFLLIRSVPDAEATAGFFFWESGSMESRFCFKEFPFDPDRLRIEETERRLSELAAAEVDTSFSIEKIEVLPAGEPPRRRIHPSRVLLIVTFTGAILCVLCGLAAGYMLRNNPTHSPATESGPPSQLSLRIHTQEKDFRITWDRNAAVLQNPHAKGLLTISDGDLPKREIKLEGDDLRSTASIVYSPFSTNVQIRLIISGNGHEVGETVVAMKGQPETGHSSTQNKAIANPATLPTEVSKDPTEAQEEAPRQPAVWKTFSLPMGKQNTDDSGRQIIPDSPVLALSSGSPVSLPVPVAETAKAPLLPGPPIVESAPARPAVPAQREITLVPDEIASRLEDKSVSGFVRPTPIRQVLPSFPLQARASITRDGEVKVKVHVDVTGKVKSAEIVSATFPQLVTDSLLAARGWQFEPAKLNGKNVDSETVLVFKIQGRAQR